MVFVVWSPKGGSGVSVLSAAVALAGARRGAGRIADLAGDQPALLALSTEPEAGLADWLEVGPEAPTEALDALALDAGRGVSILPLGARVADPAWGGDGASGAALAVALRATSPSTVTVADAGVPNRPALRALIEVADASVVVLRGCYLALRRATRDPLLEHAAGIALVEEPGRALGAAQVSDVLGKPVLARVPVRASISRVVDAGLLLRRPPEPLVRAGEALLGGLGFAGSLRGRVA